MIQLLFGVILVEVILILLLLFKTPLRKLVIMALDRVKRGKAPVMLKTVAATILVVLLSSVYSMAEIQKRTNETGSSSPTDQILMGRHLLESYLMGSMLFLALMIDRLHYYIRELRLLRKTMETGKKPSRVSASDDGNEQVKGMEEEIASLKRRLKKMASESESPK